MANIGFLDDEDNAPRGVFSSYRSVQRAAFETSGDRLYPGAPAGEGVEVEPPTMPGAAMAEALSDRGRLQSVATWTGAVLSVCIVLGLGLWAYQLIMRDVSGVPVIEALEGAARVPATTHGGEEAAHQGLAVNRIAEGEEAAPAAGRIVLAPPPVELTPVEIAPPAEPAATTAAAPAQAAPAPVTEAPATARLTAPETAPVAEETAAAPVAEPTPEAASQATLALIEQLIEEETPAVAAPAADPAATAEAPATAGTEGPTGASFAARSEIIDISVPGVRVSPRPPVRPAAIAAAAQSYSSAREAAAAPAAPAETREVDIATLAAGTRLVQLGAFDDPQTARSEWDRMAGTYPDFFADKGRVVQEAVSGGRTFFRLRVEGFADLSDARRFCATLRAGGEECIPVMVR